MRLMFGILLSLLPMALHAECITLNPPKGWECIKDPEQLPQKIRMIYIGTGKGQFTPSINLASEETVLKMDEYLALAKSYHEGQGNTQCKSLGTIETKAGKANLLQIDRKAQWGNVRFIQAVLIRERMAYVITATCLQEEFASLSSHFFKAIQSFAIAEET